MISSGSPRCLTPRTGGDDPTAVPSRPVTEPWYGKNPYGRANPRDRTRRTAPTNRATKPHAQDRLLTCGIAAECLRRREDHHAADAHHAARAHRRQRHGGRRRPAARPPGSFQPGAAQAGGEQDEVHVRLTWPGRAWLALLAGTLPSDDQLQTAQTDPSIRGDPPLPGPPRPRPPRLARPRPLRPRPPWLARPRPLRPRPPWLARP
jgi:hypothetical protein